MWNVIRMLSLLNLVGKRRGGEEGIPPNDPPQPSLELLSKLLKQKEKDILGEDGRRHNLDSLLMDKASEQEAFYQLTQLLMETAWHNGKIPVSSAAAR